MMIFETGSSNSFKKIGGAMAHPPHPVAAALKSVCHIWSAWKIHTFLKTQITEILNPHYIIAQIKKSLLPYCFVQYWSASITKIHIFIYLSFNTSYHPQDWLKKLLSNSVRVDLTFLMHYLVVLESENYSNHNM